MPELKEANGASRFNEFAFRRYEPVIQAVLKQYPKDTIVRFNELSPETFVHRLRDAARGFNTFRYPSDIDHTQFAQIWPKVEVRHDTIGGELVCRIGPKNELVATVAELTGETNSNKELTFLCPNKECLHAFLTLSTFNVFTSPVKLTGLSTDLSLYLSTSAYFSLFPHATVDERSPGVFYIY